MLNWISCSIEMKVIKFTIKDEIIKIIKNLIRA